ncbi:MULTISPECIES: YegS/Rv2252/BmrU family lipid kinase [Clostridium]|uniref:YegS/Rv2252/BmrU family lipid kinase n=1 Tax=Clostridium TaxID=1485 RepID=UPI000826A760|nr:MULTISPECIES: YegS/Rv2252/BmrU family lipid kinase [Clostridium]PJI07681.1 lipid kinase [Clostridium sp. CT7]
MNKVKFIYNPFSGENLIINNIDKVIKVHQKYGYTIVPYRIEMNCSIEEAFEDIDDTYKYVLIAGGDGTVDNVVNVMKKCNVDIPIAILPVGTANDFAKFIGMPSDIEMACEQILNSEVKKVDLGKINDKYFINVASAGLFTNVSQQTDINMKNTMGKLAYYVKGIEQIPNFKRIPLKVESKENNFDGEMILILIFNGQTAGNFKFAYKAIADDGMLDVIIIEGGMVKDLVNILIKMFKGEHLEDVNGIIYFKTDNLKIDCKENIVTDIDGERGPDFPIEISCIKGGLEIFGVKNI